MKPFNIFLTVFLAVILIGFIFFKDGFSKSQDNSSFSNKALVNRVNYLNYSEQYSSSSKRTSKTLLFFAATTWCQTCSQLDKEIMERSQELPSDLTILKVDYDNDKVTKAKYGVTAQHTLIQLDNNGNEVKRWIGGNFDALIQNIQ